jgi:hypothetical protein
LEPVDRAESLHDVSAQQRQFGQCAGRVVGGGSGARACVQLVRAPQVALGRGDLTPVGEEVPTVVEESGLPEAVALLSKPAERPRCAGEHLTMGLRVGGLRRAMDRDAEHLGFRAVASAQLCERGIDLASSRARRALEGQYERESAAEKGHAAAVAEPLSDSDSGPRRSGRCGIALNVLGPGEGMERCHFGIGVMGRAG